jgi:SPW repeat
MSHLRWQDIVNLLVGLWIATSPWVLPGYSDSLKVAMWNALVVGGVILIIALADIDSPTLWEEWTLAALGVWSIASPWVFGYSGNTLAMLNSVAAGIVVAVLAVWALVTAGGFEHHNDHAPSH